MIDYQDLSFWRGRLLPNAHPQDGPGRPDMGFKEFDIIVQDIFEKLIKKDDTVLDCGCGVGRFSSWFKNYIGFDFVPEFIDEARKLHPHRSFFVLNFNKELPFEDKQFDWAISISTIQYCADISEIKRVAKKVLIMSYGDPANYKVYE